MKTKNFLLPALAVAIFAAPSMAQVYTNLQQEIKGADSSSLYRSSEIPQDYHEIEEIAQDTIRTIQAATAKTAKPKKKYLDIGYLTDCITHDLSYSPKDLQERAKNSIKDKKITAEKQQELINLCIENDRQDILKILLEAGFVLEDETGNNIRKFPYHGSTHNGKAASPVYVVDTVPAATINIKVE